MTALWNEITDVSFLKQKNNVELLYFLAQLNLVEIIIYKQTWKQNSTIL